QGRALISVVNLHGLPSLDLQQRFVAQLAGALFTAIKKKPGAEGQAVKGLLIIDEAKDFTPSQGNPASKAPLLRLAAQARKYGLGLIFATQQPGNIDHTVTANSTNHIYGKANSPRAIEVIRNLIQLKGGSGNDVPKLNKGQFYCHSEGYAQPLKVQSPLCLSYHGDTPLSEEEVIQRARIGQD
ncbi:MAG: ATP-binding protein, partial [Oceanobacter sp.]